MPTKTTGAEFKRFYSDPTAWPDKAWHEDEEVIVDGANCSDDHDYTTIPDDAVVKVSGGVVYGLNDGKEEPSLEAHFKRWRRLQSEETFVVICDKDKLDAVQAAVKAAGGKVV